MATYNERKHILDMLESGTITPEQAATLLDALVDDDLLEAPRLQQPAEADDENGFAAGDWQAETQEPLEPDWQAEEDWQAEVDYELPPQDEPLPEPPQIPPEFRKWRQYWLGLFVVSMGLLLFSSFLMYRALESSGYGFWFFCSWIPFFLSVAVVALSWQSRTMPWLHLRVDQAPNEWPRRIAFSFPLPVGLAGWALRTFGHYIPNLENTGLSVNDMDKLIYGLKDFTSPDNPLYIEVDEDDGERVLIYIG